jgi:hypothetical protein
MREAGGIGGGSGDQKVVIHDELPIDHVAGGHQGLLGIGRVHEERVGVAQLGHPQGCPRPDRDDLDVDAALILEQRYELIQQAAVVDTGGGGKQEAVAAPARGCQCPPQGDKNDGGAICRREHSERYAPTSMTLPQDTLDSFRRRRSTGRGG